MITGVFQILHVVGFWSLTWVHIHVLQHLPYFQGHYFIIVGLQFYFNINIFFVFG